MSDLEMRIMTDIVRSIRVNGFSTAKADGQIGRMVQLGESEENIKKWIREALEITDDELEKIFSDTVYEQYYGYKRVYDTFGVRQIPFAGNIELQDLLAAVKAQTKSEFRNITDSMGFALRNPGTGNIYNSPLTEFYRDTLDGAVMDIVSGAVSYDVAISRAINVMTNSGLRTIYYDTGHSNRVEVAARRAVMTGFRQVQGKINEQVARDLGTDYFEVSYHIGARPEHQVWQGRVYSYTQLQSICGLGSVTGLHGANCYHDYNAFIPGISVRNYTDQQLEEMLEKENTPKQYLGKEYTSYQALQKQRQMERNMRKTRQDIKLLQEGEANNRSVVSKKARYQLQMQQYKAFSNAMGLPEQMQRVYQDGLGKVGRGSSVALKKLEKIQTIKNAEKDRKEKVKARFSKFSDRFETYNVGQKDIITYRRLLNNLNKTSIGRETVEYILEHPELEIQVCYGVDHQENTLGEQLGDLIRIYASDTKTVQRTAEVLIHEITHHKYNIGESQWAESVCKAQEIKHRTNKEKLTGNELRGIIKIVEELYPTLPWR
ncbi:MAG: minor capsid protein [Dorea sp.]|nr:minor capsid protein [Dorea sp.]